MSRGTIQKLLASKLIGNIIYVAILVGLCLFVYKAAADINYIWRWDRVPSYVISKVDDTFVATHSGIVEKDRDGLIRIRRSDGSAIFVTERGTLHVEVGERVVAGDLIATHKGIVFGPLARGLWMTLKISFFSIFIAIGIGIVAGLMRISPVYVLRKLAITYVELVRGTPLLVQIFILYFFFGKIFNLSQMQAGVAALSIFTGAYIAEIVRAGIQSIHKGQTEAARSLGLNYIQTMRHVILPQALRRTLPPMAGQFINLIKDSSLVSVIAITDLTKAGREVISATHSPFEIWFTVAAMYLVLTASLSYIVTRIERRLQRAD
jgi:polar amino acid transport system permease protein